MGRNDLIWAMEDRRGRGIGVLYVVRSNKGIEVDIVMVVILGVRVGFGLLSD